MSPCNDAIAYFSDGSSPHDIYRSNHRVGPRRLPRSVLHLMPFLPSVYRHSSPIANEVVTRQPMGCQVRADALEFPIIIE